MVPVTGVTNLISLTVILSESVKWMWSLYPCSVSSAMNALVHVYNVVYYHKQGDNESLCVYTNLSILFRLCRFVTKLTIQTSPLVAEFHTHGYANLRSCIESFSH